MRKNLIKRTLTIIFIMLFLFSTGCSTSYKAKPLPLQTPSAYPNKVEIQGCQIGAKAFVDGKVAKESFGFDILGAGMLPVQVVFDNQGPHPIEIVGSQTFLEDNKGTYGRSSVASSLTRGRPNMPRPRKSLKKGFTAAFWGRLPGR
jgi:hypothetical protein